MDSNSFDERLMKLENILVGIEKFMITFKNIDKDNASIVKLNEINENVDKERHTIKNQSKNDEYHDNLTTVFEKSTINETNNVNTQMNTGDNGTQNKINNTEIADNVNILSCNENGDVKNTLKVTNENNDVPNEIDKETNINIDNTMIELNKRLASIDILLKEISITLKNLKPKGYYKNWDAKHQVALSMSLVPKDVFTHVLWKMSRQVENYYTGESSVNRLLDSLPTFQVSRTSRFPSYGVYIDLNDYDIYNYCQRIREGAYSCGPKCNAMEDAFKTALAYLHNLVLCDLHEPKVAGMMYDVEEFERKYDLEWCEE